MFDLWVWVEDLWWLSWFSRFTGVGDRLGAIDGFGFGWQFINSNNTRINALPCVIWRGFARSFG